MRQIIFLFIAIFLGSCKTTKRLGPVPERSMEEVIAALKNRNIDFQWFSAKASTSLESPDENISGTLHVRMKSDSIIWVAVKKLVEVARILAEKEKYTVLYRYVSEYEVWPLRHLKSYVNIDAEFSDIQHLLFGNVIIPEASDSKLSKDSIYYVIETKSGDLSIKYYLNGYNLELSKMEISDVKGRTASVQYSDYRAVGKHDQFSYQRVYRFPNPSGEYSTITMDLSDVEIDIPKEIIFSIPSHYERIN
ncbi:MAG: DUF4292 domain-containing protein [Saprospiraceae bacterium]|nr:DUF4292 domain-containing protein [Saprospiraceae bacterium]